MKEIDILPKENGTDPTVRRILMRRIQIAQFGYFFFFAATLATNILLSLYADPTSGPQSNTYGPKVDSNGDKEGNYTISRSMTGLYSKSVASFLIPFCNLYLYGIVQYQFGIVRILFRNLVEKKISSVEEGKLMCRINSLAYAIIIWGALFLQGLCSFDAQRFTIVHFICAGLFFLCCLCYVVLMLRIQNTLVKHDLASYPKQLYMILFTMIFFFALFFCGEVAVTKVKPTPNWILVIAAIGEYGYVFFAVFAISSPEFKRKKFFDVFDFGELQSIRIFSIIDTIETCIFAENWKLIFGMESDSEEME